MVVGTRATRRLRPCAARPTGRRTARDRLWQSMRILRSFSRADLQMTADTSQTSVAQYLRALESVGYIDRLPRRGAQPLRYRLVRDTGPLAPRVLREGAALWDDNTCQEVRP